MAKIKVHPHPGITQVDARDATGVDRKTLAKIDRGEPIDLSPLVLRALAWKVHDLRRLYNLVYTLHAVIHRDLKDRTHCC